jgi:hypothetical protein
MRGLDFGFTWQMINPIKWSSALGRMKVEGKMASIGLSAVLAREWSRWQSSLQKYSQRIKYK